MVRIPLANERSAQAFYGGYAESANDAETVALARQFADEESDHARRLEERLSGLPDTPRHQREDDDAPQMPE